MPRTRSGSKMYLDDMEGIENRTPTQELLFDAFIAWQDRQRKRGIRIINDKTFAVYLGVPQNSLSMWLQGDPVGLENCLKLSRHYWGIVFP